MEKLKPLGVPTQSLPPELTHVRDLRWADGPLVSHMRDESDRPYLEIWVDQDNEWNRYLRV